VRSTAVITAFVLGLALLPVQAFALSLFGINLFGEDEEEISVIADPQPYSAEIVLTEEAEGARAAAESASALFKDRNEPASGMAGLLARARDDYGRILGALYEEGLYGASVSIRIDGREAGELPPDADIAPNPTVIIRVEPGPVFAFGNLVIENRAAPLEDAPAFSAGEVARPAAIRRAARIAVNDWRRQGHPKAEVTNQDIVARHDARLVDVGLTVTPGPRARIGAITVEGARDVDPQFIIRQSGLQPGAVYDPDAIDRAKEELVDLDLFRVVQISEDAPVGPDGTLPITIVVKEKPPRRIGAGATVSTTDGLGIETFWLHRNLFGQGERLRLDARIAGIGFPVETADFDYYLGGVFTKPGVITPDTDLTAELTAQRTVLTRYTETSAEARLGFAHEFTDELSATFGAAVKGGRYFDPVFGSRDFLTTGVYGGIEYDSRDDATDATEGIYAALDIEPYYEWVYSNPSLLATAEGRTYFSFDPESNFVLAGRVKLGALLGPPISEAPPDKLFFAGGGGSVRGFPYRSIGVPGPDGTTGGTLLAEASVEARVKVTDTIGIVGFIDAGYVSDMSFAGISEGTQIGAGLGLRYYTGLGPIRLDAAIPVNRRPGDPDYAIYAGIGQAF